MWCVCVSPGLIYICDRDNHRVTVHDEGGMFQLPSRRLRGPNGMCVDDSGAVYVGDNMFLTCFTLDCINYMLHTLEIVSIN